MSHTGIHQRKEAKADFAQGRNSAKARGGGEKRKFSWLGGSHPIPASHYYREMVVQVAPSIESQAQRGPVH